MQIAKGHKRGVIIQTRHDTDLYVGVNVTVTLTHRTKDVTRPWATASDYNGFQAAQCYHNGNKR